jgi:post-segregation antitoxin (ccd killing protein)
MSKLRSAMTKNVMNEEKMYSELKKGLGLKATKKKDSFWLRNVFISVSLVCLVVFGSFYDGLSKGKISGSLATTIISIDINPSFTLEVDANNLVLSIKAENADAEKILVSDLVGQEAALVVETIILRAQEAGFLMDPTLSDYVLVTTAPVHVGDESIADHLNDLIQEALNKEGTSDDVNVALIKATLQQWLDALDKNVPLGLYVISGLVNVNGEIMSVADFLKTSGNLELLETIAHIVKKTTLNTVSLLERFLDRLERAGVDVTTLRVRLLVDGENLAVLKADVLALWASLDPDTQAGSSLSDTAKADMKIVIEGLLAQLKALGLDVSGYETYLAADGADLQSIETELVALLNLNGVDTSMGSTLTTADKDAIVTLLNDMIKQLKVLGLDVSAYEALLAGTNPDLYALETTLKGLLAANGVDTTTGSTSAGSQTRFQELSAKINQLKLLGIDVTDFLARLNAVNPDYASLELDVNTALTANGIDTSTGSTTSSGEDDDDEDDDEDEEEDDDEDEEEDEEDEHEEEEEDEDEEDDD